MFRAVEIYFPTGWRAQVFSRYVGAFVDIRSCPVFDRPRDAIRWAEQNWG